MMKMEEITMYYGYTIPLVLSQCYSVVLGTYWDWYKGSLIPGHRHLLVQRQSENKVMPTS